MTRRLLFLTAAGAIQLRLLCNLLDGLVAIEHGKASPLGELFNEVPDRISDAATLIGAGFAMGGVPALGYVAACVAIFTAYVRAMGKVAGARQEFCGPMAKQQRMFLVTLAALYCGLAPSSWQPTWGRFGTGAMSAALVVVIVGGLFTAARRLRRIAAALSRA
jgi:phosphatidylglycerophosphate synthase